MSKSGTSDREEEKTNGNSDWFANIAEFFAKYYDSITFNGRKLQLRAHHGWAEMYKCIKREIRSEWSALHEQHPDAVTVGHKKRKLARLMNPYVYHTIYDRAELYKKSK